MSRLRLALIAGGTSGEREVSLSGAEGVEAALNKEKYEVIRYDPATDLPRLAANAKDIDVAFILLHGIHGQRAHCIGEIRSGGHRDPPCSLGLRIGQALRSCSQFGLAHSMQQDVHSAGRQ